MKKRKSFLNPVGIAVGSLLGIVLSLLSNIVTNNPFPFFDGKSSLPGIWIALIVVIVSVIILAIRQGQSQEKTEQIRAEMLQEMTLQTSLLAVFLDEQHAASGKQATSSTQLSVRWILDTLDTERKERFIRFLKEHGLITMLTTSQLQSIDLQGMQLREMDLRGRKLQGANLSNADLSDADLREADLSNATLKGANLRGANLSNAVLREADLSEVHLENATLCEADLSHANLGSASLQGANFQKTKLLKASLPAVQLQGANLSDADLRGAFLLRAHLSDAIVCRADLSGAKLWGADLRCVNLFQAKLNNAVLCTADLRDANLDEAELCGADFRGYKAPATGYGYLAGSGAHDEWTNLSGAKLQRANLTEAKFDDLIHLSDINLTGATLSNTILDELRNKSKVAGSSG